MAKDRPISSDQLGNLSLELPNFVSHFLWNTPEDWQLEPESDGLVQTIFPLPEVYPQVPDVNLPGKIPFQRKTTTPWCRGTHFWLLCALWVTPKPRKKVEQGAVSFDALIPSGCKWCFCYFCWFKWRCVLFKAIYLLTSCNYIWLGWKNTWNIKTDWLLISIYEVSMIRD